MKPRTQLEARIFKMIENEQYKKFIVESLRPFNFKNIDNNFLVDVIMMNPNIYLKPPFMLAKMKIIETDIDFTDCIKKYKLDNNKKVINNSVKKNGLNLKLACSSLRNNKEIVKSALANNGLAIEYASNKFKNDLELAITAIKNNSDSYYKISENLKNNREIIKTLLIKSPELMINFTYVDRYNMLIKEVIRNNGLALRYATESLRNTKTVVISAVRNNLKSLIYASDDLLKDEDFLIEISKKLKSDQILYYAAAHLQNKKSFIKRLIKETNLNLYLINDSLKNDIEIVKVALDSDIRNFIHASIDLRSNKNLVLNFIKSHGNILNYVDNSLLENEEFMLDAIKEYNGCIKNNIITNEIFIDKIKSINEWCNNYIINNK